MPDWCEVLGLPADLQAFLESKHNTPRFAGAGGARHPQKLRRLHLVASYLHATVTQLLTILPRDPRRWSWSDAAALWEFLSAEVALGLRFGSPRVQPRELVRQAARRLARPLAACALAAALATLVVALLMAAGGRDDDGPTQGGAVGGEAEEAAAGGSAAARLLRHLLRQGGRRRHSTASAPAPTEARVLAFRFAVAALWPRLEESAAESSALARWAAVTGALTLNPIGQG